MPKCTHMSYNLNSLRAGYIGDYIGDYYKGYEGGYYEFRLQLICPLAGEASARRS